MCIRDRCWERGDLQSGEGQGYPRRSEKYLKHLFLFTLKKIIPRSIAARYERRLFTNYYAYDEMSWTKKLKNDEIDNNYSGFYFGFTKGALMGA